ncbi:DNA polymerase III subunit gamma/tau [Mitsuaria sp. TWR114]|uniref:DNA polymerase III subunit gamma/tau n=1 Tax=Mitsuaria sp. TWR114 TaxID=2601731 RepID=UPI0011BE8D43|nr:DNA polymerase III subunit gamma/tau [Mitsuaria sp. TWR114]TXD86234.1 DNA polymerase III subunit gamma/tau [Mitsuaria sp. TWR114]
MSYQVLARKYRSRTFEELMGQEHVVQALANALTQQRLHHAYLFTGTRGVGKTSVSRILAKSLNCIGPDGTGGITAHPCNVCDACRDIDAGRFVDYVELDAASNRGVEEISQLLDQAVYKPVVGRFKVYMIDEVHMLSNTAFNAMLKTLEEPPEYLKFVLATTDPQKVPVTVLSRCLQFNLRPMAPQTVLEHLTRVLGNENVPNEPGALRLLARAARGSMRDALSLTDQAIAFGSGEFQPGTPRGDALIAHELAHVAQQDGARAPDAGRDMAETPGLEEEADRSALGALSTLYGKGSAGPPVRHGGPPTRGGLRLQRCKSESEKAREAEINRLGGLQYDFLEKQRKETEDRKRKEAEEAAKKSGLPPPVTPPTVTVDDIIKSETKAADPPKPADAWTKLDPKVQDDWKKRADAAWKKVVASVAGTELETVMKGKRLKFDPKDALEQGYFGAQLGDELEVGMQWVELAEKDAKNVWPNVAHELGGHFEYGKAYATEIMSAALERMPEAERKKWKTDPVLRQKFFDTYEYAETEIFAELRERRYAHPETGTAPPNPTDDPDVDVPRQLNVLKKALHPEVAKAVVAHLKARVDASPSLLERDKKFFAEQVKAVFGPP